jgi:uncharacterized membrane protein YtjA (UPF0391 family)
MLRMALLFLLIAIVAGVLNLAPVAWLSIEIARILFFVFLVLFILSLLGSVASGRPRDII